jgi:hypothetical protein
MSTDTSPRPPLRDRLVLLRDDLLRRLDEGAVLEPGYLRLYTSNRNSLHLIQCDLVTRAVIEFGRARAFVRGHGLGVFERAAGFEIRR